MTQIRIDRIKLIGFLNKMSVPGYESPTCQCGLAREMVTHVIMHYPRFANQRQQLVEPHTRWVNLRELAGSAMGMRRLVRWFIKLRILP